MKKNKTKKAVVLCMLAATAITACALTACGSSPEEKQDLGVTVTGAVDGAVEAVYSGAPIAVGFTSEYSVSYVVKYAGIDGTVYEESETAPADAGKYAVSVTYEGDDRYNPYALEVTLTILKAENTFTVTIADYVFGGTVSEPEVTGNKGGAVTFLYEGTGETVYAASETAPEAAGTYRVTATAAATKNYLEGTATDEFEVTFPPRTDVPAQAPVLDPSVKVLNNCFTIVVEEDTEYRIVNEAGEAVTGWQTEGEFTGLEQNTTYFVEARRPATEVNDASAAGENKLEVRTMKSGLLDNFDRREDGAGAGNFTVSAEQAHSGTLSLKAVKPDGAYGYILQPEFFVEREEGGNPYGGYWQNGSVDRNWIDLTGYRYLSFWIYFDRDAENVTFGTGTIEIWNGNDVFNCWLGEKTIPCGTWQRVVIDMTETDVLRGNFDSITEQVTKIYINFNPIPAAEIGTFYLDDIEVLADVEKQDITLTVTGEENGTINAVYSGSPAAVAVEKPKGGGTLRFSYTGIDGTEYAESETAPVGVGKYRVSISLTGNAFYNVREKEVTLVIAKAENNFTVSMENFNLGETAPEPVVTGNKGGEVTFVYEGTGNTLYEASETVPSAVGTYRVTATVAEDENYLAGAASAEFMIVSAPREDVPTQAPVLDASALILDDGFVLAVEADTEYRVLNAAGEEIVTWQTNAAFTGLEPDTVYTVEARRPAKDGYAPSAAGEQVLRVKTAERFLLDDFEKKIAGDTSCGNFLVSDEKSHSGGHSLKTGAPDGNGYILQPNALLADGNGYWEAGNYGENYIDITGYRYLSFWIYIDRDAESVTFGNPYTIEIWKEPYGKVFTCWLGEKTIACGSWQRVVIDLTQNSILNGDFAEICAHVGKIYFNFNPNGAPDVSVNDVGTFYLDDFVLLKGEEV